MKFKLPAFDSRWLVFGLVHVVGLVVVGLLVTRQARRIRDEFERTEKRVSDLRTEFDKRVSDAVSKIPKNLGVVSSGNDLVQTRRVVAGRPVYEEPTFKVWCTGSRYVMALRGSYYDEGEYSPCGLVEKVLPDGAFVRGVDGPAIIVAPVPTFVQEHESATDAGAAKPTPRRAP